MNTLDSKEALVFVNLGTPRSPAVGDVRRYLREFLMDPYVIDLSPPARWLLVNGWIAPVRAPKTAKAYEKIWLAEGSPLLVYSKRLVARLQSLMGGTVTVRLAMRYGEPSITDVMNELVTTGHNKISVFVAYPQYALSSTFSALVACRRALSRSGFTGDFRFVESYETDWRVLKGWAQSIGSLSAEFNPDHTLFSFHGLPEKHILNVSPSQCYRRQCYATADALATMAGLKAEQYSVGFQSRLSQRWIKPFSDEFYRELPKQGVKKLLVACPSFTIDCLETVEEVSIRAKAEFVRSGGEDLLLVPALNDRVEFAQAIKSIYHEPATWKAEVYVSTPNR